MSSKVYNVILDKYCSNVNINTLTDCNMTAVILLCVSPHGLMVPVARDIKTHGDVDLSTAQLTITGALLTLLAM